MQGLLDNESLLLVLLVSVAVLISILLLFRVKHALRVVNQNRDLLSELIVLQRKQTRLLDILTKNHQEKACFAERDSDLSGEDAYGDIPKFKAER